MYTCDTCKYKVDKPTKECARCRIYHDERVAERVKKDKAERPPDVWADCAKCGYEFLKKQSRSVHCISCVR